MAARALRVVVGCSRTSQLSGKPKGLEAAIPLDDLVSGHQKGKMVTKLVFEFADGSGAIVDAARIGKPETFIEAYERLSRWDQYR